MLGMDGTVGYANFRAWVPRKVLSVGTLNPQDWVYYDWGPRQFSEPLLCLHPVVGSAESFYPVMLSLADRGYRVISPQLPVYWSASEFCDGLQMFLDMLQVRCVHMYGAGVGGFLGLCFASRRPERVSSIALTHSFLSTESVEHNIVYSPAVLRWLPDFLVRNAVRSLFPRGNAELAVAEAAEFSIVRTMSCSRDELASRLALLVTKTTVVGRLQVPDDRLTIIDVFDRATRAATPVVEESAQALPNARRALLKSGGDFPYLSHGDDVAMHLVVHLRRNAAPPAEPLPPPPPARPRLPLYSRRKSATSQNSSEGGEESGGENGAGLRAAAEEQVMLAERQRMEQYAPQLAKIRGFVPDRDDEFLAAVLGDCGGDCDLAVEKIRDGAYKRRFHLKARRKAIRSAVRERRKAQGCVKSSAIVASGEASGEVAPPGGTVEVSRVDASAASAAVAAVLATAARDSDSAAPSSRDESSAGVHSLPTSSLETVLREDESRVVDSEGLGSGSEATPVNKNAQAISASSGGKERRKRPEKRSDLMKRDRYPPETDSVSAYVTSEKVGMRSTAPLIGRGPAPLVAQENRRSVPVGIHTSDERSEDIMSSEPSSDVCIQAMIAAGLPEVQSTSVLEGFEDGAKSESSLAVVGSPKGLPPSQPEVLGLRAPPLAQTPIRATSGASEKPVLGTSSQADDDGWGQFRQGGLLTLEDGSGTLHEVDVLHSSLVGSADEDVTDSVDDETARLREWMMSAQSATESVQGVRQNLK